jgi:hypothetical protein
MLQFSDKLENTIEEANKTMCYPQFFLKKIHLSQPIANPLA